MTTTTTGSPFGLDDMEALLWGASCPTADPMDLFLRPDRRDRPQGGPTSASEGGASPAASLSSPPSSNASLSSLSPPPFYSPPPSPPVALLHQGGKLGGETPDLLALPWLTQPVLPGLAHHAGHDGGKEDMFCDLDWMTERVDLSEFDLDSLMGSCGPGPPGPPDDLLASLDCPMELDALRAPPPSAPAPPTEPSVPPAEEMTVSLVDGQDVCCVPEPQEELEIKSEPVSPAPPSPSVRPPSSPADTLDLGSEVDIAACEVKPLVAAVAPQVPRIVLSLSPTRIVLLLAPKDEVGAASTTTTTTPGGLRSSPTPSTSTAPARPPRSRPYPDPTSSRHGPASPTTTTTTPGGGVKVKAPKGPGGERGPSKAPRDKKTKKMEQNKTAATRYRQKKRAEQDALGTEYSELEKRNIELTERAESMAREIQYLKELMEEVRVTRIKKDLGADL